MLHQILYMDTVFQHQETQARQYRSADYAWLLRQEVDAHVAQLVNRASKAA